MPHCQSPGPMSSLCSTGKEDLAKQATKTTLQGCCAPTIPTGIRETGIHGSEKRPLPIESMKFISTPPFCLTMKNQIVGLFELILFSSMTCDELKNLDFLAEFFHDHKSFINSVSTFNSACLGGKMNMLGWQKYMKKDEKVGHQAGLIIGKSFTQLANNTFQKNHDIMVEHIMPDFGDPKLPMSEGNNFSAASLVYTGKVSTHAQGFNVQGGEFVFPDCKFGLRFEKLDGIARMIWRETEYSHFTTCPQPNSQFTQFGFSLQLNNKTFNVFNNIKTQPASYDGLHDGDLDHIVNTVEQRKKKKK
ncbi:hypothetical protein VP01_2874g6 [Puccinia sorghi]|uniref:Tet-like 2OG-Fe(II) oxygenase domain-containing protein n=1 Tax=Puccinia sorghi TaxID=27349 RepID=A0A0L6V2J6_9BASI|nr:hypothetical protein VP01_2874g6 [Puccinia sorghi]